MAMGGARIPASLRTLAAINGRLVKHADARV